jgi:hypothetical protein
MHREGYYSSGEFAKKANVSVRTIRYYDQQNILKPSLLTDDGVRFYTKTPACLVILIGFLSSFFSIYFLKSVYLSTRYSFWLP